MNKQWLATVLLVTSVVVAHFQEARNEQVKAENAVSEIRLGNFSVSLAVKDIKASLAFYQKLGFRQIAGNQEQNWVILQNEASTIGLFQGMFDKNLLTFNPGWDRNGQALKDYDDVRDLQRILIERGLEPAEKADSDTDGPAHFTLVDPDGNPILIDQHVSRPEKSP